MGGDFNISLKGIRSDKKLVTTLYQAFTEHLDHIPQEEDSVISAALDFMAKARTLLLDRDNGEVVLDELASLVIDEIAARGGDVKTLAKKLLSGCQKIKSHQDIARHEVVNTRARIMNSALKVFSNKGYHNATVEEICEAAGLAKGTLYCYFKNKEDLFKELVRSKFNDLAMEARKFMHADRNVLSMISDCLRVYLEFFDKDKDLYKILLQEQRDFGAEMKAFYINKVLANIPIIKENIHKAVRKGLMKELNFYTVYYGVMGFVDGVMQKWLSRGCSYPLVKELPVVLEVLFYGFVNKDYVQPVAQEL